MQHRSMQSPRTSRLSAGNSTKMKLICIILMCVSSTSPQSLGIDFGDEIESNADLEEFAPLDTLNFPLTNYQNDASVHSKQICRFSELLCDTGQCISLDKYCNGENDCGDNSDEPKHCSSCNRTFFGDVGRTYELQVRRPREDRLPFLCYLNFTALGSDYGDIIQLTFDTFTVGKFVSFTSEGCPDGYMSMREDSPSPPSGQWCGSAWGYTVYFSESSSINMTLRLDRLSQQGVGYNFDFKLAYKFLRKSDARLRYGNSSLSAWRGDRVPGTYCDRTLTDCDVRPCRIQSPNFPGVYPRNVTCKYKIEHTKIPSDKHVLLAVHQSNSHKIHIKDQIVKYDRSQRVLKLWDQCNVVQDYLTVWDGPSRSSPVLARLCGGDAVPDIVSRGPRMLLEFHTSPYDNPFHPVPLSYLPGFELEVQVIYVEKDSHSYVKDSAGCQFVIRASDGISGVLTNPRHSLPPNTTCAYYFQGRPNEVVWISFIKYHATGGEPAGFDQLKDCSSQLSIWDGSPNDTVISKDRIQDGANGSLLGSFCREESPRLCDHALLANATRATRPCSAAESYVTTGPYLTILQELRQGSTLYPVSFLLRYEFVDVSQQGQPHPEAISSCDRVFRSTQTYSGRFNAPKTIFYYGRGGAQNMSCILRFEAKPGERIQLTFSSMYFGNKRCYSYKDSKTGRWRCDRSLRRSVGFAQIIVTEYPWEGVPLTRDCLCTNRSDPLIIHTLTASVVELNFTVTYMNITEDFDDYAFEGDYKFVPSGPGDDAVCSGAWGERRLRGSSGEIRLFDRRGVANPSDVMNDNNVVSESVRADAGPCAHRAWLIEPGGDGPEPTAGRYLFVQVPGYELTTETTYCPTSNRILVYEARDTTTSKEVCPSGSGILEFFSPGWLGPLLSPEEALKPHARSFVIEFLQRQEATYTLKWIEVNKKQEFALDSSLPTPLTASLSLDCPYTCPELNACIPITLWCDGAAHCPSGFDEDDSNCSFKLPLPAEYMAAGAGATLALCLLLVCICACKRKKKRQTAELKARLDGHHPQQEDRNFEAVRANGTTEPPRQYATIQKYATIDKYSLSQKYSAGLNDARYYDEVSRRDKLADTRYASLGRAGRLPPPRQQQFPDLKDGFC